MDKKPVVIVLEFLKGELRTFLALGLLLLIFVGLGFAAGEKIVFDFGTGLSSEVAPGAISVAGGASIYPQTADGITFGWATPYIAEQSSGAQVNDPLETDSNQGVGNNILKISGLTDQYYLVTLISGGLSTAITTKVVINGANYIANSNPGEWKVLTFKVVAQSGNLEFGFKRYGTNLWAVNALTLTPSGTPPGEQTFDVSVWPSEHTVQVGGTVLYKITILPVNSYGSEVILSIADLPMGMQASFQPVSGFPPFTANLEISTNSTSAITRYTLTLTARGQDPAVYSVNKILGLILVAENLPVTQYPSAVTNSKVFRQQAAANQKLIDQYLAAESRALPRQSDMDALGEIPAATSFEVLPELPQARSMVDASLRQLTSAGIIGIVVDSAPVSQMAPPSPSGFWAQFFGAMFNPAR